MVQKKAWPESHTWLVLPTFTENSCHVGTRRSHFPSCEWKGMREVWHLPAVSAPGAGSALLSWGPRGRGVAQQESFPACFCSACCACVRPDVRLTCRPQRPWVVLLLKRVMLTGREVRNSSPLHRTAFTHGTAPRSCVTLPASALRPAAIASLSNICFLFLQLSRDSWGYSARKRRQEKPTRGEGPGSRKEAISRWHSELPLAASPPLPTGSAPAL